MNATIGRAALRHKPHNPLRFRERPGRRPQRLYAVRFNKENRMNIQLSLAPLVSLIAGVLILAMPKLLNFIVAIYLILIGLIGLFGASGLHMRV